MKQGARRLRRDKSRENRSSYDFSSEPHAQGQELTMLQEETKDSMRKKRRRKSNVAVDTNSLESSSKPLISTKATRKRVSFA